MGESVKTVNGVCYVCKGSREMWSPYVSTRKIMGSDAGKDGDIFEVPVKRQDLHQLPDLSQELGSLQRRGLPFH